MTTAATDMMLQQIELSVKEKAVLHQRRSTSLLGRLDQQRADVVAGRLVVGDVGAVAQGEGLAASVEHVRVRKGCEWGDGRKWGQRV